MQPLDNWLEWALMHACRFGVLEITDWQSLWASPVQAARTAALVALADAPPVTPIANIITALAVNILRIIGLSILRIAGRVGRTRNLLDGDRKRPCASVVAGSAVHVPGRFDVAFDEHAVLDQGFNLIAAFDVDRNRAKGTPVWAHIVDHL
jgi:hypothetical protein